MENRNSDIESIILEIDRADIVANRENLDRNIREDYLVQFIKRTSSSLIDLLDELKNLRNLSAVGSTDGLKKTHRVILEGYSENNEAEALSVALDKAAKYFSEDNDISITVQQLIKLPNGGHRATVEVHITPLSLRDKPHVKGMDIELKRDHNKAFADSKEREGLSLKYLVYDQFSILTKAKTTGHFPASFIINVNDAKLMHYKLEKQFLKAEMVAKKEDEPESNPSLPSPAPTPIVVKYKREHH